MNINIFFKKKTHNVKPGLAFQNLLTSNGIFKKWKILGFLTTPKKKSLRQSLNENTPFL